MGWYVEMQGARKDPSLRAFESLSDSELATSPAFYEAMVAPDAQYDRTVFIKIAMTLKTDLMINGLVNELGVSRENALLLKQASQAYTAPEMKRGRMVPNVCYHHYSHILWIIQLNSLFQPPPSIYSLFHQPPTYPCVYRPFTTHTSFQSTSHNRR